MYSHYLNTHYHYRSEASSIQHVRRYLRDELGVRPGWIDAEAYWKRGVTGAGSHAPHEEHEEAGAAAMRHGPGLLRMLHRGGL